jgi:hypothetical protein
MLYALAAARGLGLQKTAKDVKRSVNITKIYLRSDEFGRRCRKLSRPISWSEER